MAKIYDTIKFWADGQNALNAADSERATMLQSVVRQALQRLQRCVSLADLATAYYLDEHWWPFVVQEFDLTHRDAEVSRNAAYWQRFMEIRHPAPRPNRVSGP